MLFRSENGPFFNTHQGLRQGDPLSPILFDLSSDSLAIMVNRAVNNKLISGLFTHLDADGIAILQYADDIILLIQDDLVQARNLKFLLCLFEQMSGLKINFHKSEVFCMGSAQEKTQSFERILTCKSGKFPLKYLGIPVDEKRIKNSDWNPAVEKIEKKMGSWQGKIIPIGGRSQLINASLTSVPLYMLSFFRVPVGIRKKMDSYRAKFLWDEDEKKGNTIWWVGLKSVYQKTVVVSGF